MGSLKVAALNGRIANSVGSSVALEVLDQLRKALPASAMVFNDPTTLVFWARSYWKCYAPRTWFVASGFGTLGFATHMGLATLGRLLTLGVGFAILCTLVVLPSLLPLRAPRERTLGEPSEGVGVDPTQA